MQDPTRNTAGTAYPETRLEAAGNEAPPDRSGDRPVELDRLREICSGDKAFERELIQVFLTDTLDRIRAMETALRDKNLEAFRVQAHSVKGASANAGAEQMTSIAGSMEAAGPGGNGRDVSRLLRDLKEEYEQVRLFLTDYLENDLPRADELL